MATYNNIKHIVINGNTYSIGFPVTSVNSKTGAVSLTASDVGAATSGHTHTTSLTQTGTSTITLESAKNYTLTAGGTSVVFKMPTISSIPSNNVTGSGTTNKIPKFTGTYTIGDGYGVTDNSSSTAVTSTDTNLITGRTLYYAGYTKNAGTITGVTGNNGLTGSGTSGSVTIGHANAAITAQTTQAVYPIKIDAYGHITAYGSAVTIPSMPTYTVSNGLLTIG